MQKEDMGKTVYGSVEECIKEYFGSSAVITGRSYVGGGDINEAGLLTLSGGETVFMKSNTIAKKDFFRAEQQGLAAIADTGAVRTPKLLGRGVDETVGISFLLLEYVKGMPQMPDFWGDFGHALATMHLAGTSAFTHSDGGSGAYGFYEDNYIGATKQINTPKDSWVEFFITCRLEPQFDMAGRYFDKQEKKRIADFLEKIHAYISEPERPSLLHGDLWSGNYIVGNDRRAWLIDPAVYVGHFEADLAMTELFGGFSRRFYEAYSEVNPIDPSYKDRKPVYNLYHLLNHLNLFGPAYLGGVLDTVRRYV